MYIYVQGYLKMNLLPRVRYILEVMFPDELAPVHTHLLEMVTRIARHSMAAAAQVRDHMTLERDHMTLERDHMTLPSGHHCHLSTCITRENMPHL